MTLFEVFFKAILWTFGILLLLSFLDAGENTFFSSLAYSDLGVLFIFALTFLVLYNYPKNNNSNSKPAQEKAPALQEPAGAKHAYDEHDHGDHGGHDEHKEHGGHDDHGHEEHDEHGHGEHDEHGEHEEEHGHH